MTSTSSMRLVYITVGSMEAAKSIGGQMVEQRLAACANILPGMVSVYRWEGALEHGEEVVLLLKTTEARVADLLKAIEAAHDYDTPCAIVLSVEQGLPDFINWVAEETEPQS